MTAIPLSRHVDPLVVPGPGFAVVGGGVFPFDSQICPFVVVQSLVDHFPSTFELPITQS